MIVFKNVRDLSGFLIQQRKKYQFIGFVPTMGALHQGHLTLINASTRANDLTVCSIFINPTQFNDPEDFKKYPVTTDDDINLLEHSGCDILFLPAVSEIYPSGLIQKEKYDLGNLENILEGEFRPGHFQGVCQVVHRLLEIVLPDRLYLGQKDYQQYLVIKKLIQITGLETKIKTEMVPTVRETDGLAMSSRNKRLSDEDRKTAPEISKALLYIKKNIKKGNLKELLDVATRQLNAKGFKIDYIKIADAENLTEITDWDGRLKIVALAAAFLKTVRLIDNMPVN